MRHGLMARFRPGQRRGGRPHTGANHGDNRDRDPRTDARDTAVCVTCHLSGAANAHALDVKTWRIRRMRPGSQMAISPSEAGGITPRAHKRKVYSNDGKFDPPIGATCSHGHAAVGPLGDCITPTDHLRAAPAHTATETDGICLPAAAP